MTKSSLCSSSSSGFRNSSSAGSLTRTGLLLGDRKHKLRQNKGGSGEIGNMSSTVDASGEPIPTSAVLMVASKHIATRCRSENVAFIKCKKKDANPEKCLEKGRQVTSCVLNVLKDLHRKCPKELDAYAGCMFYYTNELDLCRKEQQAFEKAYPI